MKIRVLAFASAADAIGSRESEIELPDGSAVAELRRRLEELHPALGSQWDRLAVAVDGSIAEGDPELADGAEVALLPPVSGGARRGAESPARRRPASAGDPERDVR